MKWKGLMAVLFYGVVFRRIGSDSAEIAMSYHPGEYHQYSNVDINILKHKLIIYDSRSIKGLPETIKASPETQSIAELRGR